MCRIASGRFVVPTAAAVIVDNVEPAMLVKMGSAFAFRTVQTRRVGLTGAAANVAVVMTTTCARMIGVMTAPANIRLTTYRVMMVTLVPETTTATQESVPE